MKIYAQKEITTWLKTIFSMHWINLKKALVLASINDSEKKKMQKKNKYWGFRKSSVNKIFLK